MICRTGDPMRGGYRIAFLQRHHKDVPKPAQKCRKPSNRVKGGNLPRAEWVTRHFTKKERYQAKTGECWGIE